MVRYEYLHQQHQHLIADRNRERDWTLQWQAEKLQYERWVANVQRIMVMLTLILS